MRIIKPGEAKVENQSAYKPSWLDDWLRNQGKWIQLECGCIEDVHLPQCITLLTGKKIYIDCPNGHSFQLAKKGVTFKEAMISKGYTFPDNPDDELPPF